MIKRYLKHNQVSLHRHQVSGVNFKGATVNNAVVGTLHNSKFCQADLQSNLEQPKAKNQDNIHKWNGFNLRSTAAVKIAETLDNEEIVFSPNYPLRLTTSTGRKTLIFDFLIFDIGKSGILQIDDSESSNPLEREEIINLIQCQGFESVRNYPARLCSEHPETVVADFLRFLRRE